MFRPGKNTTGYNLCTRRWQVHVNPNGSSIEFREYYYKALTKEQHKVYDREANELTVKKEWNDDTFKAPLH
ncbi:hypothetical protein HYDPIDRAFT_105728 [Hydnomerulius pinastri MD-312]|nr:hypothetical protein HYDPIDRAFT_105728 [Hydnomerulius pinastri MD-312]